MTQQAAPENPPKKTSWLKIGVMGSAALFATYVLGTVTKSVDEDDIPRPAAYAKFTANQLSRAFDANPRRASETLKKSGIEVSGEIGAISGEYTDASLLLETPSGAHSVITYIDESETAKLNKLDTGGMVTVQCVKAVERNATVFLMNCKLGGVPFNGI